MKPPASILNGTFRYVPSTSTSIAETWRRFGWRPMTAEERRKKRERANEAVADPIAAVTPAMGERFEDIERRTFGHDGFEDAVRKIGQIETAFGLGNLARLTAPPPPGA